MAACAWPARGIRAVDSILRRVLPWLVPLALAACASLPTERAATPSCALADTAGTALGLTIPQSVLGRADEVIQ